MNGKIQKVLATHIVLECNNIGYLIKVPNPYSFSENVTTCVHLHLIVREDAHDLYGFLTDLERDMFVKLINVKGLGFGCLIGKTSLYKLIANSNQVSILIMSHNSHVITAGRTGSVLESGLNGGLVCNGNIFNEEICVSSIGVRQTEIE